MKKYWRVYISYLGISLEYRPEIITSILLEIIKTSSVLILWIAIFKTNKQIGQLDLNGILIYYLLVPLTGHITYVTISRTLGQEIKDGILSNYLLKPYKVWLVSLMKDLAKKTNLLILLTPIYAIIISAFFIYTQKPFFKADNITQGIIMLIMGLLVHFSLDLTISWSAFWIEDVWFFGHLKRIIFGIFSGNFFPLQLLSPFLFSIFAILPFRYLYFVPINYIINGGSTLEFFSDILHGVVWIAVLCFINIWLWNKGIKRYEAYGR